MVKLLILIHALLGGFALLSGAGALFTRKGSRPHILSGRAFFWSMLVSALLALVIAWMPGHLNRFLFAIGLFTVYLLLSGYRSVRLAGRGEADPLDWLLSVAMCLVGTGMFVYGWSLLEERQSAGMVQMVFGGLGLLFGLQDIRFFRQSHNAQANPWLRRHVGRMCGGYIAAFTAFIVVNELLPTLWAFLTPTVAGSLFIAYWIRRVRLGKI